MADSNIKRPYTTSKVYIGTSTFPSKALIDSEGSLPRKKVFISSADHIKKRLNLRHTLVERPSRAAVDPASFSSRTSALNRLLRFESETRKKMKLLRGCLIPKGVLRPTSTLKTRPLSANAWQIQIKRQQQADMTTPAKLMQIEGSDYNKSLSATATELHRQLRPLHELNQRPLRKMYQQSSESYESRLSSRRTAAKASCENSSNDASRDNFIIISKAPRHTHQTRLSRLRLQSKTVQAAAETQTDLVTSPLEVFGIEEDDEVESPLVGARYFAL
jgi:hypothetical protein